MEQLILIQGVNMKQEVSMNQTLLNLLAHLKVPEFDQSVYLCLLDSKDNKNTEQEIIDEIKENYENKNIDSQDF